MELVGTLKLIEVFVGLEAGFLKFLEIPKFVLDGSLFPG